MAIAGCDSNTVCPFFFRHEQSFSSFLVNDPTFKILPHDGALVCQLGTNHKEKGYKYTAIILNLLCEQRYFDKYKNNGKNLWVLFTWLKNTIKICIAFNHLLCFNFLNATEQKVFATQVSGTPGM